MMDWRVIALGLVYMGCNIPQYGLSFFLGFKWPGTLPIVGR
jgi:hypothetical protein